MEEKLNTSQMQPWFSFDGDSEMVLKEMPFMLDFRDFLNIQLYVDIVLKEYWETWKGRKNVT